MRVFVTGADGFIGSHLAEALVARGHDVTALAQYNSFDSYGWLDECEGMEKVRGDVRDAEQMFRLMSGQDIVFHLAALISVPYSYQAPQSFVDTNVTGTLNILNAALRVGAKVIHMSSSEVYGTAQYEPQDEAHPLNAQSPYAASKIAADQMVAAFNRTYDLPAVIMRPFNTYGPRQSERAVIPSIIRQHLDPRCEAIELGAVDTARDFVYVDDTVLALCMAMLLEDIGPHNVGTGRAWTISDVVSLVSDKPVSESRERARPPESEVKVLRADAERFRAATGWEPGVVLPAGLNYTRDWWRDRPLRRGQEALV